MIKNVVVGLLTETQSLLQIAATAEDTSTFSKVEPEPLKKQVEIVAILLESLAQMIPNSEHEIVPLISEFCTTSAPASKRMTLNSYMSKTIAIRDVLRKLFTAMIKELRSLAEDSKHANEIKSHGLIEAMTDVLVKLSAQDGPADALKPRSRPATIPKLRPLSFHADDAEKSPTSNLTKSPNFLGRVISMIKRPKSTSEAYSKTTAVRADASPTSKSAERDLPNVDAILLDSPEGEKITRSLSRGIAEFPSAAFLGPAQPVPHFDPSTFNQTDQSKGTNKLPFVRSKSMREVKSSPSDSGWPEMPEFLKKKDEDDVMDANEVAIRRKKSIARTKSFLLKDTENLLLVTEPMSGIVGRQQANNSRRGSTISMKDEKDLKNSAQSIAAALFGDPTLPIETALNLNKKEHVRTFSEEQGMKMMQFYIHMTNEKMKVFIHHTQKRVFEVDLTKWETERIITLNDLREDYRRTEVLEIMQNKKNLSFFNVCAHTMMYSNLVPMGQIVLESTFKITVHADGISSALHKPIFSLTGEIESGRFMMIGRDKESRSQRNVGSSSGWVTKKTLKLGKDEVCECNLEIEEHIFYDVDDDVEVDDLSRTADVAADTLRRHSQLLIAGIVLALASKDRDM
ncbi:hypothetical protein BC830DRAFT_1081577 [Chytriomyces sp. MP71]|nr:hypothetical protein BC830DRAFT_1081577 [Chytriomyces sp. MP71]